jgi:hypothetical protein
MFVTFFFFNLPNIAIKIIQKSTYQQGQKWQLFLPTSGLVSFVLLKK